MKSWDIAVMIHKPRLELFTMEIHIYCVRKTGQSLKKENFNLKGMSKNHQLAQEKIQRQCMVLQISILECGAC